MIEKNNMLIADSNCILTDGDVYASIIDLGIGKNKSDYREITIEEYKKTLETEELSNEYNVNN